MASIPLLVTPCIWIHCPKMANNWISPETWRKTREIAPRESLEEAERYSSELLMMARECSWRAIRSKSYLKWIQYLTYSTKNYSCSWYLFPPTRTFPENDFIDCRLSHGASHNYRTISDSVIFRCNLVKFFILEPSQSPVHTTKLNFLKKVTRKW